MTGRKATTWRRTEVRPLGHLHRPRLYRYRPADTRPRLLLNRYPFSVIGAGVVLRGWCWCVKWADAAGYEPVSSAARKPS